MMSGRDHASLETLLIIYFVDLMWNEKIIKCIVGYLTIHLT